MAETGLGSREGRILAALLRIHEARNALVAPYWATQAGLAERTGVARSNLVRPLFLLEKRGLVVKRVTLVEGQRRAKSVYFLSDHGASLAGGLTRVLAPASLETERIPAPGPLFGRAKELKEILDWWREGTTAALYIQGMAGIGKTTLMLGAIQQLGGSAPTFYLRLRPWSSARQLLEGLARFLEARSRTSLRSYLQSLNARGESLDLGTALLDLSEDLSGLRCLLAFDDFHEASDEASFVVGWVLERARAEDVRLLLNGRETRSPLDARAVRTGRAVLVRLGGLDESSVSRILESRGQPARLPGDDARKLLEFTGGNPLFIQLMRDTDDLSRPSDLRDFLQAEILGKLARQEREILDALSVYREPVVAVAVAGSGDLDALSRLVGRSLVEADETSGSVAMHDVLRTHVVNSITPEDRRRLHGRAAGFYSGQKSAAAIIEQLWHLQQAGDSSARGALLAAEGERLIESGYAGPLLRSFETGPERSDDPSLELLRADCLRATGDLPGAMQGYIRVARTTRSVDLKVRALEGEARTRRSLGELNRAERACASAISACRRIPDRRARTRIERRLMVERGSIMASGSQPRSAATMLNKVMRSALAAGEARVAAACANSLGNAHRQLGNYRTAQRFYRESVKRYRVCGDEHTAGLVLSNLGLNRLDLGDYDGALESLGESLRASERTGDRLGGGMVLFNLGTISLNREEWEQARHYLERVLGIGRQMSNDRFVATALDGLADLHLRQGDHVSAVAPFREAGALIRRLGDRLLHLSHCAAQAEILRLRKRYAPALAVLRSAAQAPEVAASPTIRGLMRLFRAEILLDRMDLVNAAAEARGALRCFTGTRGDHHERGRAFELLGRIEQARGDRRAMRRAYSEAIRLYAMIGNASGVGRCRATLAGESG